MTTVLNVEGLEHRFGDLLAVGGVSFFIDSGETYGLLGPNGAGKTTTISMISGLLEADRGAVQVAGQPMTTTSTAAKQAIGLVPQDLAIYPDLTAKENLSFFGSLYGMRGAALSGRIGEVLEMVGLSDRADDKAEEYSGGMKRRLNIGVGLLHGPQLLILDEPTVGVDPQSRNAILESVEALSTEGMSVLYTTHYMEEAERLCDRVGIIDNGLLVAEGSRRDLVDSIGQNDTVHISGTGDLRSATEALRTTDGVVQAAEAHGVITLMVDRAASRLPSILAAVGASGVSVTAVDVTEPNLEAVFLHLTGKALRDET
jgi:ABC-2 type transport system ATP-binding protein